MKKSRLKVFHRGSFGDDPHRASRPSSPCATAMAPVKLKVENEKRLAMNDPPNQKWKNLRRTIFGEGEIAQKYPFCAMPVTELLKLDKWVPHQLLLAQGIVRECTPDDDVIFVSHQWLGFRHPDPAHEQLKALKLIIRRLLNGELSVESNITLQVIYGLQMTTTPDEWKRRLPNMLIWFDYTSVPQPSADKGLVPTGGVDVRMSADHRSLSEQLTAAVDSIPTYIERCSMMWVLTPPCKHQDLSDTICDFASWRARGWCRLEYAASKLARGEDMPIMVIRSADGVPEYFNPCDTMKLAAAKGTFTVEDDRDKVNDTLQSMFESKVAYYFEQGDLTLARLLRCFAPMFLPRGETSTLGVGGLAKVREVFKWGDDATEAAWQKQTGWTLLTLAAAMDDEDAVRELLGTDEGKAMLKAHGKLVPLNTPLRKQPFSKLFLDMAIGMSPLMAAVTFSRPSVITLLLDAGAPMPTGTKLFGESPCQFRGMFAGKIDNIKLILDKFPDLASRVNQLGTTGVHFACMLSEGQGQCDILKELLSHGGEKTLNTHHFALGTPLMVLGANPDADPNAVRVLQEAAASALEGGVLTDGTVSTVGMATTITKVLRFIMPLLSRLGKVQAKGMIRMLRAGPKKGPHPDGSTALHIAATRGHVRTVAAMAALPSINTQAKDKFGLTAFQRAHDETHGAYDVAFKPLLGGGAARVAVQAV